MMVTTQIQKALAKVGMKMTMVVSKVSYTNSSVGVPVALNDNAVREKCGASSYMASLVFFDSFSSRQHEQNYRNMFTYLIALMYYVQ